ncbi:MAG: hypothetical protein H6574_03555 [Lewinellaceae bacterium]|nr:hypothetical protein [Lewinellaceae bacterium]
MAYLNQIIHKTCAQIRQFKSGGYYAFIAASMLKVGFFYVLLVLAVVIAGKFLINLDLTYSSIVSPFSTAQVLTIFIISESILGWIPPDLFMIWAEKFDHPLEMLTVLGLLSYLGGIVSYKIGAWIANRQKARVFIEKRLQKYSALTQKWGGVFIAVSALFPFSPFATVTLAVSLLKYPFNRFLIFGLFRILRFIGQGLLLFELLDWDLVSKLP